MKCPNCSFPLKENPRGSYKCPQCEVYGDKERIQRIKAGLNMVDPLIEQDKEKLRERENLRRFIIRFVPRPSLIIKTSRVSDSEEPKKKPAESRTKVELGFLIGSMEVAAFLGWFATNTYSFASGKLHYIEFIVPFMILLHGILFIFLFRK